MNRISEEKRRKAVQLLKQNLTNEQIFLELEISKSTLARIRKEYGFPPAKVGRPKQTKQEPQKKTRTGSRPATMPEIKAVKCASGARFA